MHYRRALALLAIPLLACTSDENPKPDPAGSGGASSSSSTSIATSTSASSTGSTSSSTGSGPATYTSGSRLKVRSLEATDGASQQIGFYDTQLEANCFFYAAEDGLQRCLPSSVGSLSTIYFSDAACTVQANLIMTTPTCTSPPDLYAFEVVPQSCATLYRVHRAVEPKVTAYTKVGMTCTPVPGAFDAYLAVVMSPTEFVAATEAVD